MEYIAKLDQIESRFEDLTRQMADPVVIGDPDNYRKTAKARYARALRRVSEYCKRYRHVRLPEQHQQLCRMLRGHYAYYGTVGNSKSIRAFAHQVPRIWQKWLKRRSGRHTLTWEKFNRLLELRRLIPQELQRLETAADDPAIGAADFLRSSPCAEDLVAMKDALDKYPTLSEASTTS